MAERGRNRSRSHGIAPEFLDLDFLIGVDSDHVVKFRGDRPRELGGPLASQTRKLCYRKDDRAMRAI